MAAALDAKSTTIEGQLLEVAEKIADLQSDVTPAGSNPDNLTVISGYTRNMVTGAVTFTVTLPVSSAPDSVTGKPVLSVEEVFS